MVREIKHIEGIYLLVARQPGRTPLYYIGEAGDIGARFSTHRRERRIALSQYELRLFVLRELNERSVSQRQRHERLFKVAATRIGLPITNRNLGLGRDLADVDLSAEISALEQALDILRGQQ